MYALVSTHSIGLFCPFCHSQSESHTDFLCPSACSPDMWTQTPAAGKHLQKRPVSVISAKCCSSAQGVWQDIQYRHRPGWENKFMKALVKVQPSEWLCLAQFAHSAFGCKVAVETWIVWLSEGTGFQLFLHLYLMCTSTTCIIVIICWYKPLHTDYWIFKCGQGTRS